MCHQSYMLLLTAQPGNSLECSIPGGNSTLSTVHGKDCGLKLHVFSQDVVRGCLCFPRMLCMAVRVQAEGESAPSRNLCWQGLLFIMSMGTGPPLGFVVVSNQGLAHTGNTFRSDHEDVKLCSWLCGLGKQRENGAQATLWETLWR